MTCCRPCSSRTLTTNSANLRSVRNSTRRCSPRRECDATRAAPPENVPSADRQGQQTRPAGRWGVETNALSWLSQRLVIADQRLVRRLKTLSFVVDLDTLTTADQPSGLYDVTTTGRPLRSKNASGQIDVTGRRLQWRTLGQRFEATGWMFFESGSVGKDATMSNQGDTSPGFHRQQDPLETHYGTRKTRKTPSGRVFASVRGGT